MFKKSCSVALTISTIVFAVVPEAYFGKIEWFPCISTEINIIFNRFFTFIVILLVSLLIIILYWKYRKHVCIEKNHYTIRIEYGNLLKKKSVKKVIPFDECYTTKVGDAPSDINPNSICGQYLNAHPNPNIKGLISKAKLIPSKIKSKFDNLECYESGRLVPDGDFLLMSFAKLDSDGLGRMSRKEYLDCLSLLWEEIDKYYGQTDVCIPILGSGITRLGDDSLTQQELLDLIIQSYWLSPNKIKSPNQLHIVCKRAKGFSLQHIYGVL